MKYVMEFFTEFRYDRNKFKDSFVVFIAGSGETKREKSR